LMKTTRRSMTVAALLLVLAPWTAVCVRANQAEHKAVKAIRKLDGEITRDEKAKGKPIVGVFLTGTQVTNAGLKHLAGLKQLQTLDLGGTKVTDKGKADLKKALPKLEIIG
jgi:hypothetical protein